MTSSSPASGPDGLRGAEARRSAGPHLFGLDSPGEPAPPWTTREWFNAGDALQLTDLRGQVVVLHAFQMLCPACVHHGLPQAQRIQATFAARGVAVIGLHTVFEHHAAMTPISLQAFLHEYRITFPVGVDAPSGDARDPIPVTMRAYGMQGTPSLVLIDRKGQLRHHAFGAEDDLALGAAIAALVVESN
jgi:peroxiredoxin